MAGNQTHGFDLVMEFSQVAIHDLLGVLFDSNNLLCNILTDIGAGAVCDIFHMDVELVTPTDATLPPGASDVVDIKIGLGTNSSAGSLRIVAGVAVDRSVNDLDVINIDLAHRLYFAHASIGVLSIPDPVFKGVLSSDIKELILLPVPVKRNNAGSGEVRQVDAHVIDDGGGNGAICAAFTYGGENPGNPADLTPSIVPPGERGAIAVSFPWLCRLLTPGVVSALSLPAGSFDNCHLNQTVRVDQKNEIDLTQLDLAAANDGIQLTLTLQKSGFCYTATGKAGALLTINITNGNLQAGFKIDDPTIDVDIPWYCYLAGAILGALVGAIFGVIGAIVGAVLVPLITYIAVHIITGTINDIAKTIVDNINKLIPNVDVPAVVINILFQEAHIDDIFIQADVRPVDNSPVRSTGVLTVYNGQYFDLDNGKVGDENLPGADMAWTSRYLDGDLRTVCSTALAETGHYAADLTRYDLYQFQYATPFTVPFNEIATFNPFGNLFGGDFFQVTRLVFAVHTNEKRFSEIQVVRVEQDFIQVFYKTYEKFLPTLELQGAFQCETLFYTPKDAVMYFEPNNRLALAAANLGGLTAEQVPPVITQPRAAVPGAAASAASSGAITAASSGAITAASSGAPCVSKTGADFAPNDPSIGRWVGSYVHPNTNVGVFIAATNGLQTPIRYHWEIDGNPLTSNSGQVTGGGITIHYQITGRTLTLTLPAQAAEIEIGVQVVDAKDTALETSRCIRYTPQCPVITVVNPIYAVYQPTYMQVFGIAEVPPKTEPTGGTIG